MPITIGWRMKDGQLEEKSFSGLECPEGWFDNPRLESNTPETVEVLDESQAVDEPVEVISTVTDERTSEAPEGGGTVTDENPSEDEATE